MSVRTLVKSIQDIMRQDTGVDGDAQRISQLCWMFFLKIIDDQDQELEITQSDYRSPIPEKLQWRNWAADPEGLTGEALTAFINGELFPALKGLAINLVIAVTDGDWFGMLRQQPNLAEVNFWAPSAISFRALQPGELFLFKLHAPRNVIVGGGIFAYANALPCSLAWEAFREANGARSAQEMRARIARYRRADPDDRSDFEIGCRILTQPFFFDEADWIPVPASWAPNIVSFKTYSTGDAEGLALWEAVNDRLNRPSFSGMAEAQAQFGEPQLIRPRLGQGAFRVLVTDIYNRRCAITHERTLPALEAAHIRPYGDGGEHEARNGLLFRRDIHSLFDAGYVTVTPDLRFEVSRRIKEEFDNGRHYYELHGKPIFAPKDTLRRPDPEALCWHNENPFRG